MANLLEKGIRLHRKRHKIENKLLHPKGGLKAYILKRDGRTKRFTILAIFDNFGTEFDNWRHSQFIEFAVQPSESFSDGSVSRTMREVAEVADYIATVENLTGESVVYAIRTGDEYKPYWLNFTYRYFIRQVGDRFNPTTDAQ